MWTCIMDGLLRTIWWNNPLWLMTFIERVLIFVCILNCMLTWRISSIFSVCSYVRAYFLFLSPTSLSTSLHLIRLLSHSQSLSPVLTHTCTLVPMELLTLSFFVTWAGKAWYWTPLITFIFLSVNGALVVLEPTVFCIEENFFFWCILNSDLERIDN